MYISCIGIHNSEELLHYISFTQKAPTPSPPTELRRPYDKHEHIDAHLG